jgi:hypothetical protein
MMGQVEKNYTADATFNLIERVWAECRRQPAALAIESGLGYETITQKISISITSWTIKGERKWHHRN